MIIGLPIFQGDTDQEQLAKIYNVIGEPSNKSSISKGKGWTNVTIFLLLL